MRDIDGFIDGADVRLRMRASGHGSAVVFIHGWALDSEMWTPQLAALCNEYRTVAFDRRGFGDSSGEPCVIADVMDLRWLMDALGIAEATVVGMSQGARVAALFAVAHPSRITQLVLDGTPTLSADERSAAEIPMQHYRTLVQRRGMEAFRQEWLHHPLMRLHTPDKTMNTLLQRIVERSPGRDLLMHELPDTPLIDTATLEVATLIVNGALDSIARHAAAEQLAHALRHSRRAVVPGAGHLPNLDKPDFYNETLREFLVRRQ